MATSPRVSAEQESEDPKKKRLRSPAYPFINLETAIKRAKTFYDKDGRGASPLTVAAKHWGYEPKSSGSTQTAAALMSFGLMVDEGTGDKRKVKLTANALKILLDNRADSTEKVALLKQIALTPKIHQQVWEKWGNAENVSDENIQHVLVFDWEPPFNENTVAGFIKEYRDTIAFANLVESDKVPSEGGKIEEAGDGTSYVPQVGDYVQWESQGVERFEEPVKILSLNSDRTFAFVAETTSGLPVGQLSRAKAPLKLTQPEQRSTSPQTTVKEDVYSIDEGRMVVQWPAVLSAESIEILKAQLKILERKISNCLAKGDKQEQS